MNLIFQWRLNWNTVVGKVEKRQVQTSATSLGPINTALIGLPLDYNKNSMGKDVEQRRCYVLHVNCYSLQTKHTTFVCYRHRVPDMDFQNAIKTQWRCYVLHVNCSALYIDRDQTYKLYRPLQPRARYILHDSNWNHEYIWLSFVVLCSNIV